MKPVPGWFPQWALVILGLADVWLGDGKAVAPFLAASFVIGVVRDIEAARRERGL